MSKKNTSKQDSPKMENTELQDKEVIQDKETTNQQEENAEAQNTEEAQDNLQQRYDELNDKYLRLFSEFDNYRKRTIKEKAELALTASENVIKDLLTVIDDYERALKAMESSETIADLEGIKLIYNKLKSTLAQKGLQEIEALGVIFNPDEHEAVTNFPTGNEEDKGKILDVVQKGYSLNGKVIRYPKVVVGC